MIPSNYPSIKRHFAAALSSAAMLTLGSAANAALVYSQDFETLSLGDLNGQAGWTADATVDVGSGGFGFTSGSLSIAGGSQSLLLDQPTSGSNGNTASVGIGSQSGQDLFLSFTWNKTSSNPDTSNDFFRLQLTNSGTPTNTNDYVGIQLSSDTLGARARLGGTDSAYQGAGSALTSTETYFVAARAIWNGTSYNSIQVWINPLTTLAAPSVASEYLHTATASIASGITSVSSLAFLSGATGGNLDSGDVIRIDNLRVGTAFSDVSLVPEPSSFAAIAGLGMLGFALLRRRR